MSRRGKKKPTSDGQQKTTNAPVKARTRKCDDELTTLTEEMRPAHRRFAELVLAGQLGAKAAVGAGFSAASARSIAYRLLRREDVRRLIRLSQRELAVAARVTMPALVDRLWRTVTDESATARAKEAAMKHLVRILIAGPRGLGEDAAQGDELGLTDEKALTIEARIITGRRRAT